MKKCLIAACLSLFAFSQILSGAEITVPNLDLVSRGKMEDGDFGIRSSIEAEIAISGGYKYGFSLGLGVEIPDLGKSLSYGRLDLPYAAGGHPSDAEYNIMIDEINDRLNNQATLSIRSLNATIREVFDKALEISFFIGHFDKLGSGDEFQEYFGTEPIGTSLRGFFYYTDGLNNDPFFRFNGSIHSVMGTGVGIKGIFGNIIPAFYIYHDLSFPKHQNNQGGSYQPGRYSTDAKVLINGENAKFELIMGYTHANHDNNVLRGGALAWFGTGPLSFLMQTGISYYEIGTTMDIDNCYFLMEPRLRFDKFGANLTFFYHPVYYMNRVIWDDVNTAEKARGRADINLRVFYGGIQKSAFETGLEVLVNLKVQNGEEVKLWLSPFISTVTTGLQWDFALRFNPRFFWDKKDLMEGFIGIRTSY
ncbi:MAG: hypothetical protein FWG07_06025 [Treponema sp.]|nr:hypothetical protein [Treponema sp.]